MKGKTLLFYSDEPNPHGVAHYNHSILLALVRAGWDVVSAHPKFESPMLEEQRQAGIRHIWTNWNWGKAFVRSMTDTAEPERILAGVQPDLVFFSDCWPISSIAAKHVVLARKIPFLVICHSGDPTLKQAFPNCLGVVAKQLPEAGELIAVAQSSLEVLRRDYGLPANKGVVIYNGRPAAYFAPTAPARRAELRAEIGVPENGVLCFTAARFDLAKGYQFQLAALKQLGDTLRRHSLHLAWAGTGELQAQAQAAIAELQLADRVHFLGHRWDVADWMGAADIFALTTMKEAMPLSVMEAMAKGLPVIATAVGGIPEELGDTGILLPDPNLDPGGTATEFARALGNLASRPELRRKLGRAAHERASRLFRAETMVEKTLALCERVARSAPARRPTERQVVVKLQGGLGNQMFQYAAGVALARRTKAKLKLDLSFLRVRTPRANFTYRDYCLDLFQLAPDCDVLADGSALAKSLGPRREVQFNYDATFEKWQPDVYLDGYWQSPKYFEPVKAEIARTFAAYKTPFTPAQQALAEKIAGCVAVCLNVRRGDYVANPVANAFHGVCDENYFRRAVALVRERVPDAHFFIFSDDIEWCRTANLTAGAPATLCTHDYAGDRFGAYLRLMTSCRHFIIPNSSFGWWAAYLGAAPDKIVITPEPWFDNPANNTVDLLPPSWIRLPKKTAEAPVFAGAPMVSVIVLCHNYARYLREAVGSVLEQTYRDFEIVLLDDGSSDDSLAVAQQLAAENAGRVSVRVFRLEDVGPTAARRFGAAQARGRYLLQLDADDKLAPEFLASTVSVLEANPKLGFAYTQIVSFGEDAPAWKLQPYNFALLCRQNNAAYCSLTRRSAYEQVGGHDPENWGYYEDWDLWIRLGAAGWEGQLVDRPLFYYRRHFSSSLSLFGTRLDPIYKAFVVSRHLELYGKETRVWAERTLAEMPPGWNRRAPLRRAEEIEPLLAQHPGNRHLLYLLALAHQRAERPGDAARVARELIAKHPEDRQAAELLARIAPTVSAPIEQTLSSATSMSSPHADTSASASSPLSLQPVKAANGALEARFLRELATRFQLTAFVETGTFLGNTTAVAGTIFPAVHTIELSEQLAQRAAQRFADQPHIRVHQGDSATMLEQVAATISGPALYWLDGHFSEGVTARGAGNTPILAELEILRRAGRKDAVILIDDLRLFEGRPLAVDEGSSLHGYPSINAVHQAVLAIDPGYQFFVFGDVALAYPGSTACTVSPLVLALTISRMFDGENLPIDEVMTAESLIGEASGEKLDVLRALPRVSRDIEVHGLGLHYRLWHAATLLRENKAAEPCRHYVQLIEFGFPHWRVGWYLAVALHIAGEEAQAREILVAVTQDAPDFAPAKTLLASLPAPAPKPTPAAQRPSLSATAETLPQLRAFGVHRAGQPLRLHLGCGEKRFNGYVNIDYPPSEHTCQTQIGADVFGDITKLHFPAESVDEIRLHHVFEHFQRSHSLAMLIRWHEALKVGGRLHIETPDIDGCAKQLASNIPFRMKQAVIRHCFGSQEAGWAIHYDGWSEQKYHHILGQLGFSVETSTTCWPQPPHLANVHAMATKQRSLSRQELLVVADQILSDYIVADVPSERGMCDVWRKAMRDFLVANELAPAAAPRRSGSQAAPADRATARNGLRILTGVDAANAGFDNDDPARNGEHLVIRSLIRSEDTVLDIGANAGEWSRQVLAAAPGVDLHAFEPLPDTFATLAKTLAGTNATIHRIALSDCTGEKTFFHFANQPELSGMNSCYRRPEVEQRLQRPSTATSVATQTLDAFVAHQKIEKIDFAKIDVEGSELDVLKGAADTFASGRIKLVQFEYGGTYKDAGITLRQAFEWLTQFEFRLFRIAPQGLVAVTEWSDDLENYRYANYLGVAPEHPDFPLPLGAGSTASVA